MLTALAGVIREYNRCMGGLLQPTPTPAEHESSNKLPVLIAFVGIALIVLIAVLATRQKPKPQAAPPLYASNIKFSDFKMSEAQNFVGSSVTYLDGTVANLGDKTLLDALAPAYLNHVPDDQFALQGALRYRRTKAGYVLYSVGPDGKDDGGRPIDSPKTKSLVMEDSVGDIVAGVNR